MLLTILAIALPMRGCKNEVIVPSISEFDCKQQPLEYRVPATPGITMRTTNCKDYIFEPDKLSKAINLFVERYADHFEMSEGEVWGHLKSLSIEVSVIPKVVVNVYDINGKFLKKETYVTGLATSKYSIWVEIKTSQIWSSSLAHELVHIVIWRINGVHGDPDHEGGKFSGWTKEHTRFIKLFNLELMDLDI